MRRVKATLVVQDDFSEEVTSEPSPEYLEGTTDPQGLNTRGRGDKNSNLTMVLFCRRIRKDTGTEKGYK